MSFETSGTDDLDNLQLPNLPPSTKTNGKASAKAPTSAASAAPVVKWGDTKVQSGDGLNRLKSSADRQLRFALIEMNPVGQLTHFINAGQRKGYFACPGQSCPMCAREDARWLGACLAVQYTNADQNGKLAADKAPEYEIGYVSLSAAHFKTLSEGAEGVTPFDIDWVMSFDGKRYSFRPVSTTPRYKKAGDEAKVAALAAPLKAKLGNKVGKKITALELKALLSNAPTLESISDMEED